MNLYYVQIDYTLAGSATQLRLGIQRRAQNPGTAISAAVAAFQAVSNVRIPDGNDPPVYTPYINVVQATATLVS